MADAFDCAGPHDVRIQRGIDIQIKQLFKFSFKLTWRSNSSSMLEVKLKCISGSPLRPEQHSRARLARFPRARNWKGGGVIFYSDFRIFFKFRVTVFGTENDIDFYHGFLGCFLVLCRESILLPRMGQKCVANSGTENDTDFSHGFLNISTWFWGRRQRRNRARPSSNSVIILRGWRSIILVCVFRIFQRPPKREGGARDERSGRENVRMVVNSESAFEDKGEPAT